MHLIVYQTPAGWHDIQDLMDQLNDVRRGSMGKFENLIDELEPGQTTVRFFSRSDVAHYGFALDRFPPYSTAKTSRNFFGWMELTRLHWNHGLHPA